jgi:hypothetical protein
MCGHGDRAYRLPLSSLCVQRLGLAEESICPLGPGDRLGNEPAQVLFAQRPLPLQQQPQPVLAGLRRARAVARPLQGRRHVGPMIATRHRRRQQRAIRYFRPRSH